MMIDSDGYERDDLGRKILQRLNVLQFMRAIPGFIEQFRPVPKGHFTHDSTGITVSCPCGRTTIIDGGHLRNCDGCERVFLFIGRGDLLVGNSPIAKEAVDTR